MIEADVTTATGTVQTLYAYDADGNRVASTSNGVQTRYLIDTVQPYAEVLLEYRPSGLIVASYVYGNSLISQSRSRVLSYYQKDGSYLFAGQQRDTATGLDYLRARYMNPGTGRFVSKDPLSGSLNNPITRNGYVYANLNPAVLTDLSGKEADLVGILVGLAILSDLQMSTSAAPAAGSHPLETFESIYQSFGVVRYALEHNNRDPEQAGKFLTNLRDVQSNPNVRNAEHYLFWWFRVKEGHETLLSELYWSVGALGYSAFKSLGPAARGLAGLLYGDGRPASEPSVLEALFGVFGSTDRGLKLPYLLGWQLTSL